MTITITHRHTGTVIYTSEQPTMFGALVEAVVAGADLRSALLYGADLTGADLHGANLADAYLRDAYLTGADLSGADLSGAVLRDADLSGASLSGADLTGANLRYANLARAYLTGTNLSGADLTGADLHGANLRDAVQDGADLTGVDLADANGLSSLPATAPCPAVPVIPNIHRTLLRAVTTEGCRLDMSQWHRCDTAHCRAGWIVTLAGAPGEELERAVGTARAAALIYRASDPECRTPWWYAKNEAAMADIRACAEREAAKETAQA